MLIANKSQETNRLEGLSDIVAANVQFHIKFLAQQIKEIEQLISNHIKKHKDLISSFLEIVMNHNPRTWPLKKTQQ